MCRLGSKLSGWTADAAAMHVVQPPISACALLVMQATTDPTDCTTCAPGLGLLKNTATRKHSCQGNTCTGECRTAGTFNGEDGEGKPRLAQRCGQGCECPLRSAAAPSMLLPSSPLFARLPCSCKL